MNIRRYLCTLIVLAGTFLTCSPGEAQLQVIGDGGPGPVKAQHLTAELVSLAPAIAPGGTLQVGLVLTLEEHWHVYWMNAGDAGEPPKITWTLPSGISAGPMQFPIPSRLPNGPLMDFGYEDSVAFPVELTVAKSVKPGPVHVDAQVRWLVCREVCIPGKAHLGLNLTVTPGASAPVQPVGALGEALTLIPKPLPGDAKVTVTGGKSDFVITLTTGKRETDAEFYPSEPDQIENAAEQPVEPMPDGVRIRVKRAPELTKLPGELHGLIKLSDTVAYDVTASVVPGEVPEDQCDWTGFYWWDHSEPDAVCVSGAVSEGVGAGAVFRRRTWPFAQSWAGVHVRHSGFVLDYCGGAAGATCGGQPGGMGLSATVSDVYCAAGSGALLLCDVAGGAV
jgi:DsbC/DsbD-like thiol-disulfide interchange protein